MAEVKDLLGRAIESIERKTEIDSDELIFHMEDGSSYKMYHEQSCCERVRIKDIDGDINDLFCAPLTMAEVVTNSDSSGDEVEESHTWTFYKFATRYGYVTISWLGTSNGYYSEEVDFSEIKVK